jgi:hypothetical protein
MKIIKKTRDWFIKKVVNFLVKHYGPNKEKKKEEENIILKTNVGHVPIEFPKEGGVYSYIPGEAEPFPGVPDEKIVNALAFAKRIVPIFCKASWISIKDHIPLTENYSKPVREIYRVISLIRERENEEQIEMRGKWTEVRDIFCMILESEINPDTLDEEAQKNIASIKRKIGKVFFDYGWSVLENFIPKATERYCRPVREIYRVIGLAIDKIEDSNLKKEIEKVRNLICVGFEFDDAYRFRFMDIVTDIKLKEFDCLSDNPKFKIYIEALKQVNLKELDFDEPHKYWARKKWKYNFKFLKEEQKNGTEKK